MLKTFAKESAHSDLATENELAEKSLEMHGIEVSVDSAWQKQGSQRSYSSLSGFTSTIGKETQKVVHFNSRIKRCQTCLKVSVAKKSPPSQRCHVNWMGSAKTMEPDMFAEMI